MNRRDADRLVDETADLVPQLALSGEPLPPRLPCTATVYAAGEIGPGHVAIIRRTMARLDKVDGLDPADWVWAEATLAAGRDPALPGRAGAGGGAGAGATPDPDGAAPDPREERDDELLISSRRDGTLRMTAVIRGVVNAEIVREGFDAASTPAGPRRRPVAGEPAGGGAGRVRARRARRRRHPRRRRHRATPTPSRRRARSPSAREPEPDPSWTGAGADPAAPPARASGAALRRRQPPRSMGRPLLTITMDHRWLQAAVGHGTLDSGHLADAATVRRWACDAEIIPIVLGTKSEPLDVGRLARTATDAIRRALNLRDGGCAFPGCTRPPRRCHAHHIHHWLDGGDTDLDNMVLLCQHHHLVIHHDHWHHPDDRRAALVHPPTLDRPRPTTPTRRTTTRPTPCPGWPPANGLGRLSGAAVEQTAASWIGVRPARPALAGPSAARCPRPCSGRG